MKVQSAGPSERRPFRKRQVTLARMPFPRPPTLLGSRHASFGKNKWASSIPTQADMSIVAITFTPRADELSAVHDAAAKLGCTVEERQVSREPRAALELLSPGAVVLFLTSAYFGALFAELGKRHAPAIESALTALYRLACVHAKRILRAGESGNPFQGTPTQDGMQAGPAVVLLVRDPEERNMRFILPVALPDEHLCTAMAHLLPALRVAEAERNCNLPVAGVPALPERAYVFLPNEGWQRLEVLIARKLKKG